MKFTLISEKDQYALILRGESMTQYAVVSGLDKNTGSWDWTCCYYDFGEHSRMSKAEALFRALDYFRMRTDPKYISYARLIEIATLLKDGLIEDDEGEAYDYMAETLELSDTEAEYFGLDMVKCREARGDDAVPSSTGGDYSPSNPWDAPGMSVSDFI